MANPIWTGAVSGDISTAGNWSTGSAPTSTDGCVFDQPGANAPVQGTLTNTGPIMVTDRFTQNWGNDANYPTFGAASSVTIMGKGSMYKFATGGTMALVELNTSSAQNVVFVGGTITDLTVNRGNLIVNASAVVTNLRSIDASNIEFASAGTALTLFHGKAKRTKITDRNVTTMLAGNGTKTVWYGTAKAATYYGLEGTEYNDRGTGVATTINLIGKGAVYTPAGNTTPGSQTKAFTVNVMTGASFYSSAGGATVAGMTVNKFGIEDNQGNGGVPTIQ